VEPTVIPKRFWRVGRYRTQVIPTYKGSLQERSLDIDRALKSVNLIQSSLDCRANVEQFNHQCFERGAEICEPLDKEVKKPRICERQIVYYNTGADPETLLTGGLSYGAIFSIIDGTNCSPKAVLACRSNLFLCAIETGRKTSL
jgi:hypothetical protein